MGLSDMPFIVALAEWVWGSNSDPSVTASQCLSTIPLPLLTFGAMPCLSALIAKAVGVAILWGSLGGGGGVRRGHHVQQFRVVQCAAGESVIVLVQTLVIVGLIWRFRDPVVGVGHVAMAVAGYAVYLYEC